MGQRGLHNHQRYRRGGAEKADASRGYAGSRRREGSAGDYGGGSEGRRAFQGRHGRGDAGSSGAVAGSVQNLEGEVSGCASTPYGGRHGDRGQRVRLCPRTERKAFGRSDCGGGQRIRQRSLRPRQHYEKGTAVYFQLRNRFHGIWPACLHRSLHCRI